MIRLLRRWVRGRRWRQAAARVARPVEYLVIDHPMYGQRGPRFEIHRAGYIPIESARECGLIVEGNRIGGAHRQATFVDADIARRLREHPLWVSDEDWPD